MEFYCEQERGSAASRRGRAQPRSIAAENSGSVSWPEYARILVVAAAALFCSLRLWKSYATIDVLGLAAICVGGYPIFSRALTSLMKRQLTVELSLAVAIVASLYIGESSIGLAVILFYLLLRAIEEKTIARGRRSLYQLSERRVPRIVAAVEKALEVPAPIQTTADWILRFLVCLSLGAAFLAPLTTGNLRSGISVIIVASACGLTSCTFLPILGAMTRAAQRRVLIKATVSLEELASVNIAVLDKTADPALGSLQTVQLPSSERSYSNVRRAMGLLNKMKIETILFTDDLEPIGQAIADKLGVNFLEAELFPEDKVCKIAALRRHARSVVMLSGGVNDGPALVEADVGVVIGSANDIAEELGDIVFSGESLYDFVGVIAIARRARRIITTNLVLTTLVASIGIGVAMGGWLDPPLAIAIRFISELALMANAARWLPSPTKAGGDRHGAGSG